MNTQRLKELMESRAVKQSELADAIGVTQAFMSYLIKGFKTPSVDVLKRIANYFRVPIDELVS